MRRISDSGGRARLLLGLWTTLLFLFLTSSQLVMAQGEKGAVSGTVTDASGAVVVGATVNVKSVGTNATRTTTTNETGFYVVSNLPPGDYDFTIGASGFANLTQRYSVSPGTRGTLDAALRAKGSETTVEVVGSAANQVDTQTSSITEVIDQKRVGSLPSLTRDPYDFVQTLGNVNQDSASGSGGRDEIVRGTGVSINGQRSASTDILLDGGENVDLFTTKVGQSVPLDAVQEFSVSSSNFSAEYGRASGGVINVSTKSGTNQFHGSVYEFNRISALTSNDFEDAAAGNPKGVYTRNQFGYSIGGPILKNKLFFFSSTEWQRTRSNANVRAVIPDDALLAASDPATQQFFNTFGIKRPNLRTESTLNAVQAGVCTAAGCTNPIVQAYGLTKPMFDIVDYQTPTDAGGGAPKNEYSTTNRIDYQLSDKTTMFGRYSLFNQNEFAGFINNSPYAGYDTGQTQFNNNVMFSVTHVWSPNVVSDSKIVFNRLNLQQPLGTVPVSPTLFFSSNFPVTVNGLLINLPGYASTTPGASLPFGGPQNVAEFSQAVSWNRGSHQLRFGGQYIYTRDNRTFGAFENAVEAFDDNDPLQGGVADLLQGQVGTFQVVVDPQGKFPCTKDAQFHTVITPACEINLPTTQPSFSRSNRYNDLAFYGQDTWKVSSRLTLNLGLRWEYYGVQHNKDDRLDSNFVMGSGNTIFDRLRDGQVFTVGATPNSPASPVGGLWKPQYHDFAPRVGFAYDVFGDGKTSLRGGYGIAYERNFGNITFNVIQNPPAQFNSVFQPGGAIAVNNLGPFAGTGTIALRPPSLRYVREDIPTAYSQMWNLSLQRELMRNTVFALEYTGSRGIHEYSLENLNQVGEGIIRLGEDPATTSVLDRLNRQYGNMNTRGANGFSYYNALNTRVTSSNLLHQGIDLNVNYTYSHAIDNLSSTFSETPQTINLGLLDPFNPQLDKGSADFDARHRVAISAVWDLPYAHGLHGVMRQALDGWQFAPILVARTGQPFTVFNSTGNTGFDTVFARYIPSGPIALSGTTSGPDQGGNVFNYLSLPAAIGYAEPLTGSPELPTCTLTTNSLGHTVSTGQNCQFPADMTRRNSFMSPDYYNINLAIGKTFPLTERFKLQFRSEFYNLLNHSNYYVQSGFAADAGSVNGGPLTIIGKRGVNPAPGIANERRFIQMALRLSF